MTCGNLIQVSFIFKILVNFEWKKINYESSTPNPRFGHTSTIYQKKLFIFGGKTKLYNNFSVLSDLEIYNLEEKSFRSPLILSKVTCKPRRNHIAELIGHQILIHGGFNEDNIVLGDCYLLNLQALKWVSVIINEDTPTPFLAGHTSCLVLPNDIKYSARLNIYKLPEERVKKTSNVKVIRIFLIILSFRLKRKEFIFSEGKSARLPCRMIFGF